MLTISAAVRVAPPPTPGRRKVGGARFSTPVRTVALLDRGLEGAPLLASPDMNVPRPTSQ
ncbi:hypothetical protein BN77_4237 [Rhizobium mesoamericanum STM3625]|uniref:Uncharacterized protein n=1 Tax=Rhizobium mesoamericanum STM3625 TaxID=1211777 RepID=K0Q034_9HYPH|nr:hypothetical protein BN77_4237 [Rhizobium mesoamericanum STM3625]